MTQISSHGIALNPVAPGFGELRNSTDIVDDASALRARMREDGYLFFRGLLDRELVLKARREILLKYAIIGEIDPEKPLMDAVAASDTAIDRVNLRAFSESVRSGIEYERVVLHPRLLGIHRRLLGGEVHAFDFRWPRFVRPGEACGFHYDGPYMMRGTDRIFSSWIPLGDVSRSEGALILLEGSHRQQALLKNYARKDADRDRIPWLGTDPIKLQARYGGRWLSTDFAAGDVLCFTMHTLHGALDNNSPEGRCRLSSDTRYQCADEPQDERWNGVNPIAHGRDKVFCPGMGNWNNRDFQDEWKRVDVRGRLVMPPPNDNKD